MKTIYENPTVNDEILFHLDTIQNVDNLNEIKIYFLEKSNIKSKEIYEVSFDNSTINQENFSLLNNKKFKNKITSSEMNLIFNIKNQKLNRKDNIFEFNWNAKSNLVGDYLIYWDWLFEGKLYSKTIKFSLINDLKFPKPFINFYDTIGKYETLMNVFTPRFLKFLLTAKDATPMIIEFLNKGIAKELAFIENNLNEIQEIYDVNNANNQILKLFASFLGKSLKTDDETLWKRQIKNAVSLFKKKGTKEGLEEALDECDIKLKKITKLWQVASEYYFTESFNLENETSFLLSKTPLDDIEIYIKKDTNYELAKNLEYEFLESLDFPGKTILNIKNFSQGKYLKIIYNYIEVPSERKNLEKYIKSLPLMDDRNEEDQQYPLKNWNIKLIEETDPLFDLIINEKNPFYDPIIYGKIRTTFLYSENIYNMDSYNGSLRNSYNPCDIDKNFIDNCNYGQSSKFNIDLEIKDLSDTKIAEAKSIIKEFIPFHASVHHLNIYGLNKDYLINYKEVCNLQIDSEIITKIDCDLKNYIYVYDDQGTIDYYIEENNE